MIVYEVNLDVDAAIYAEYRVWLTEHVNAMIAIRGFTGAHVFERTDPPPAAQQRRARLPRDRRRPRTVSARRRRAHARRRRAALHGTIQREPARADAESRVGWGSTHRSLRL